MVAHVLQTRASCSFSNPQILATRTSGVLAAASGSAWETETDLRAASKAVVKFLILTVAIGTLRLAHSSWLVGCGEEANGIVYNTPNAS